MDMQLAGLTLDSPFIFAPLAGVTRAPVRLLARRGGAALVYTEMVSAMGLSLSQPQTLRLARVWPDEAPLALQLFGADPGRMRLAAAKARELGADILDVNLGCPARKVRRQGAGSALLDSPERARAVVAGAAEGWGGPVTVKLRLGFDRDDLAEIVPGLVEAGAAAICLHARTTRQGFAGQADWAAIARLKAWCPVPVIGNGDVISAEGAVAMLKQTGCDAVMIGRGALGDPWIFSRAADLLAGRQPRPVSLSERRRALAEHAELALREGEALALHLSRLLLIWFCKGLPGASEIRRAAGCARSWREVLRLGDSYFANLEAV